MKILFVILTCDQYKETRRKWQAETWLNTTIDYIYLDKPMEGKEDTYKNLCQKYEGFFLSYLTDLLCNYDWFFFCDDDTFVFVNDLKKFLSLCDSSKPILIGSKLAPYLVSKATTLTISACSGGAGIAVSNKLVAAISEYIKTRAYLLLGSEADVNLAIWAYLSTPDLSLIDASYWFKPIKPIFKDNKDAITWHYCDELDFKYLAQQIGRKILK